MIDNVLWLLVEAGTSFFEIILILTFLDGFLEEKESTKKRKCFAVLGAFAMIFIVSTLLYSTPLAVFFNFFIVTLILSFILYKGKMFQRMFTCILLLALLVVAEFISVYILVLSLDFDPTIIQTNPALKFAGVVVKNLLSLAAIKIICNFRKSYVREAGRLYISLLLVVPAISIFIAIEIFELARAYNSNLYTIMFAFMGLMYINAIVFALFESIMRNFDKEYKYHMIENQLEMQMNHYNKLAESREIISEGVHDFKNHLNCMYNLYKYNKLAELGKYIENLINVSDTEKVIDTGNPVIDALLHDKSNAAEKEGIGFKHMLNLPSDINIAYNDICAVLGNSLDNAIEACRRIEDQSLNREIELSMNYRDSYLVIVVTNTIDKPPQKEGKFFRSSKDTPGLHGLGMQSIERTVRKYNGNMVVKHDSSRFTLEIVMSLA